jgi:hypothetical protein
MDRKEMKKCFACLRNEKSKKQMGKRKILVEMKSRLFPPNNAVTLLLSFRMIHNTSRSYDPSSR